MKSLRIYSFALLLVIAWNAVSAQPAVTGASMAAANELFKQQKFEESAKAYADVTLTEPKNGRAWYFLGMSLHSLKRYREAIAAFEKNFEIARNPLSLYNIACGHARLGATDAAFEALEKAINAGAPVSNLATDPDLESLRSDPRFKRLLEIADRAARPCMYSAEARQFDFWVGDWDVFNLAGQKAGTNQVILFSNGCGLLENWVGTLGGDGKSVNFYDSGTKKWYQSWIGSGGGALRYAGSFVDGAMRFEGETVGADGKKTLQKLTFSKIDENTVRQLAETSVDGGKTWAVTYDFKYVRRK